MLQTQSLVTLKDQRKTIIKKWATKWAPETTHLHHFPNYWLLQSLP